VNLLLDVGNTKLKWAQLVDGNLRLGAPIIHKDYQMYEAVAGLWQHLPTPNQVVAANVAGPQIAAALAAWVWDNWQLEITFLRATKSALGVTNGYDAPHLLGIDRWLNLLAAWQQTHDAVCVIDCGTAVTIDAVDSHGLHRGGLIIPGLETMRTSLIEKTNGIHDLSAPIGASPALLATNTTNAVYGGTLYAAVSCIDNIINELQHELNTDFQIFLTGGDAIRIKNMLMHHCTVEPKLLFLGMQEVMAEFCAV
jgi:type III pantothenate kinase